MIELCFVQFSVVIYTFSASVFNMGLRDGPSALVPFYFLLFWIFKQWSLRISFCSLITMHCLCTGGHTSFSTRKKEKVHVEFIHDFKVIHIEGLTDLKLFICK